MDLPFRYYLRVRYGECDAQKVVFNARYGEYVELAATEFMRALGFGAELADGRLDYQLVKQTTEWRAPARFDDVLEARVSARHLGNTSFSLGVDIHRAGESLPLATVETVYVMVTTALQKTPLPTAFREALAEGARGRYADHAGHFSAGG